jgi:glycosyltransferase involved in cell wall biosynthesis
MEHDPHSELGRVFQQVVRMPLRLAKRGSLRDRVNYGLNLFSGRPHSMTKYCRPEVSDALKQHLARHRYDVIVCDFLLTAAVIPWENPSPKIIFTHNVEAVIWKRHFNVSRNPLWKAISWREYRTMDDMERHYLRQADHVLTVSEEDRKTFSEFLDPKKITVIETGVDLKYFRTSPEQDNPYSMVFTGSMDWLPNEDAILFFVEQVLPKVRLCFPQARVTVVGRSPSARIRALASADPGLTITGKVEDVRPYVESSSVYIVPLRIGGGTRIKIFEAMAMGKPVVSTRIGAEGLPVTDNDNILLADTAEAFADRVILLLGNAEARWRIGRSARSLVEANHSWASVARRFDAVFDSLIETSELPVSTLA